MEETLKTVIDKETGQELRAQFHDQIAENEMLIEALRMEPMEKHQGDRPLVEAVKYWQRKQWDCNLECKKHKSRI